MHQVLTSHLHMDTCIQWFRSLSLSLFFGKQVSSWHVVTIYLYAGKYFGELKLALMDWHKSVDIESIDSIKVELKMGNLSFVTFSWKWKSGELKSRLIEIIIPDSIKMRMNQNPDFQKSG